MTAYAQARLCCEPLLNDGLSAKTACEVHTVFYALKAADAESRRRQKFYIVS